MARAGRNPEWRAGLRSLAGRRLDVPKALLLVPFDTPGGAERIVTSAALELARRPGWAVTIVSLGAPTGAGFLDGLDPSIEVSYGRRRYGLLSEWRVLGRLLKDRYDLVFASQMRINGVLSWARATGLLKTRRLVTRESTVFADRASGVRLAVYRALYRLYGGQDEIWAQTGYMADKTRLVLAPRAAGKVRRVPNPIDVQAVRTAAAEPLEPALAAQLARRPHIVWCGRLIDIKAPVLAVEALAVARRVSGLDLGLVMVGAGPLEAAVRAAARQWDVEEAVIFTGNMANPYPVLAAARLGLLTSVREGFANVLLEMMAAGTPSIVTTPCAGDLDSLGGVEVVQDHTAEALGRALAQAATAASDRTTLYAAALADRTPQQFVDRLLGIDHE